MSNSKKQTMDRTERRKWLRENPHASVEETLMAKEIAEREMRNSISVKNKLK